MGSTVARSVTETVTDTQVILRTRTRDKSEPIGNRQGAYTPAILLGDEQLSLLCNAERFVFENYCSAHCSRRRKAGHVAACPSFSAARDGNIACDGFDPDGAVVA